MKLSIAVALCALAPTPLAQVMSKGLMLGAPMTVLVGPGTISPSGPLDSARLHGKPVGYEPYAPDALPSLPTGPVFTAAALFGDGVSPPAFEVNAISLGLDPVPASTPAGGISLVTLAGPDDWGMLSFSVTRSSLGAPGSLLAYERSQPGGAAADLFTYILPGSDLPAGLSDCYPIDQTHRSLDALEMDLSDGTSLGDLRGLDFFMGLYESGEPLQSLLPGHPRVFFSIEHDGIFPPGGAVSLVDPAWFGGPANMSSATILVTTWNPGTLSWNPPVVFLSYAQLGLDIEDDIDALSVDFVECKALFSIRRTPVSTLGDQLQIVDWCVEGPGVNVGTWSCNDGSGTEPVANRLGMAADDDIDGTCTEDPGVQGLILPVAYGVPVGKVKNKKTIAASMFRDQATAGPTITIMAEGLPTTGLPRLLELYIGLPTVPGLEIIFPALVTDMVGAGSIDSHRQVSFTHPNLALSVNLPLNVFWIIRGAGMPIECSPTIQIGL